MVPPETMPLFGLGDPVEVPHIGGRNVPLAHLVTHPIGLVGEGDEHRAGLVAEGDLGG